MRKHPLWPLALAAAAWLSPMHVQAQQALLTLEQALQQAASRHPSLAAAGRELQAAQAAAQQAAAWRNPELNTTLEDTRRETRTATVTVDIPIELGGKRGARIGAAGRAVGLAAAERDKAAAELRARVVGDFFALLVAQERAGLAASAVELAGRAADATRRRVEAGKVPPLEATRARVDLANAQLALDEAQAGLQAARRALATLLGEASPAFDAVAGDATAAPERPGLAELTAQLDAAPALLAVRAEAQRRRALIEVERSKATPDLSLSLGARHDATLGRAQAVIGLSMPLPLFDRNQAAVVEASRRAEAADEALQAARLDLLAELEQASGRLAVASRSLQLLQGTVLPAAQEAYEAAAKGFDAGKLGFLELIDAQRSLLQARSRTLDTLAAAWQAAASIDRITGR